MTEAELLAALRADPADASAAAVYADWLLERGDARGELIQVQLQLEAMRAGDAGRAALEAREAELLPLAAGRWAALGARWRVWRGFLDELDVPAAVFLGHAAAAPELGLLRRLVLRGEPSMSLRSFAAAALASLLGQPVLASLEQLELRGVRLDAPAMRALAAAPLPRLRRLVLDGVPLRADAVAAFAAESGLPGLSSLVLRTASLTDETALLLAGWPGLGRLRELDVSSVDVYDPWCNQLGDRGAGALLAALPAGEMAGEPAGGLAGEPVGGLVRLDLGDNPRITNETVARLAGERGRSSLSWLGLGFTGVNDAGAELLARSPWLSSLSGIEVGHTGVGDAGLAWLLSLPRLSWLGLSGSRLTRAGLARLLDAPAQLASVDLRLRIDAPAAMQAALRARFGAGVELY